MANRNGHILLIGGIAGFCLILGILIVSIITLTKVNKNNKNDGNSVPNTSTNTTTQTPATTTGAANKDCMKKSTLSPASDNSTFDPFKWGSLRGQLYFGMQTRHPLSPRFGILWQNKGQRLPVRYWYSSNNNDVVRCMWTDADGESFGEQPISDHGLDMRTSWINQNKSFSAKISVDNTTVNGSYTMLVYFALQDESSFFKEMTVNPNTGLVQKVGGTFNSLGDFEITVTSAGTGKTSQAFLADTPFVEMATVEAFITRFQSCDNQSNCVLNGTSLLPYSNLFVLQTDFTGKDYSLQFNYKLKSDPDLPDFDSTFASRKAAFRTRFGQVFPIPDGDVAASYLDMGRAALSNMLGAVSYWHGYSNATGSCMTDGQTVEYGPLDLIAGEPSRPDFPRGFLWDDGFHNLLIRQFDPDLSLQIISSWLDTMNTYGWIPREMFLTKEAQAKIGPGPWLVERDDVANPPMLIYLVSKLMADQTVMAQYGSRVERLYPRLRLFYTWMKEIQKGPVQGSFQWQGRDATDEGSLNPPTLPSGLDDFPRATHPSKDEYHVDIKCWMAMSSTVLLNLATLVNDTAWLPTIQADQKLFNDLELLDKLHWSTSANGYYDYGNHSFDVILVNETRDGVFREYRHTLVQPVNRLTTDVFGYINIFPFLLRLLPANSTKLGIMLTNITDPNGLWTDFGLRSVSKMDGANKARYYDAYNNVGNAPYWRGPIWININYLALDAFKYYSQIEGPYKDLCAQKYTELRQNIVVNMGKVFQSTGFIWEHYNDKTGAGEGTRPFTGWSALVLAIMGNDYR